MKDRAARLVLIALDLLGINAIFRFLNRQKVLIVWYHGVCDDSFDLLRGYDERHVPTSVFRGQMEFLKSKGYVFVTPSELVEIMKRKKPVPKLALITFDDGYRNVIENAYPVMRDLNVKGCLYVVSNMMGTQRPLWTDYVETVIRDCQSDQFTFLFKDEAVVYELDSKPARERAMKDIKRKLRSISDTEREVHLEQLNGKPHDVPADFLFASWEQLKAVDPNLLEIGSHTRNHPDCGRLESPAEFEDELSNSKTHIEQMTGREVKHFCYPGSSSYDAAVITRVNAYVKRYGYESAMSTILGLNDESSDPFMLKRVCATEDFRLFKATTSGSYMPFNFFRRVSSRLRPKGLTAINQS